MGREITRVEGHILTKRLRVAFGFGLALAVLLVAADAWRRLDVATVRASPGAHPSRDVGRDAVWIDVCLLVLAVAMLTVLALTLTSHSAKNRGEDAVGEGVPPGRYGEWPAGNRPFAWAIGRRDRRRRPFSVGPFAVACERLRKLHEDLASGEEVTDEVVLDVFENYDRQLQTNCELAAERLLIAAAPICGRRPHLVGPLMRRALVPLVSLKYERAGDVQRFVARILEGSRTDPPLEAVGRAWLQHGFPRCLGMIQELLDELVQEAEGVA